MKLALPTNSSAPARFAAASASGVLNNASATTSGAARPVPRPEVLRQLRRVLGARDAVMLHLGPLTAGESAQLLSELLGAWPGPNLSRFAERVSSRALC